MPKGVSTCQYNGCGKSCMRENGCYRHSEIGRQNKREAMKVYKQSDAYKKSVEEREREKREALEAEAERRVEKKRKQIIEYRKSLKRSGLEDKKLTDPKSPPSGGEEKEESDDESHPSSCSTCTSSSEDEENEEGEEDDIDKQVDEMHKKMDQLQVDDKIDVSGNLDSIEELEEDEN